MPDVSRFLSARIGPLIPVSGLILLPLIAVRPVSDPSPWLHLHVGEFLREGGRFGTPDPWAPFASRTYVPTQWLPEIAMSVAYEHFGIASLAWARGMGIVLVALAVYALALRVSRPAVATPVTAVTLAAAWPWLTERPQLLGFAFLVVSISGWWGSAMDHQPRWWLIPLTWLMACTHGVWFLAIAIGGMVVVALAVERAARNNEIVRLGAVLGCSVVAAALTPLGPGLLLTPFGVGSNGRVFVQEWFPSSVRTPAVALALLMLSATYLMWLRNGRRPQVWRIFAFITSICLTLSMERTVPVGAFLAAPLLSEQLEGAVRRRTNSSTSTALATLRLPFAAATLVAALLAVPLAGARASESSDMPRALIPALAALPSHTRVLAEGDLTGWLLFTADHAQPVFDLRIEVYEPGYVNAFLDAQEAAPGWDHYVARTGATAAVLRGDSPLSAALSEQLRWRVSGRDNGYVLMVRRA